MSYPSVVRIYATTQDPDYDSPWQARTPSSSTGSGVIVGEGKILTGAHVVANSTFLQVQKISDPNKVIAQVESICHDCDLALLNVEDPNFIKGSTPASIGDLPSLRDRVSVVGFPVGGEEISITEGVVSRIEVQRYSHSQRSFLAVTVDAAINSGNSGGPVFKDGKVAGIAFQKLNNADNIGEMVPAPLICRFLEGIKRNKDPEMPGLGFSTQKLENPVLRKKVGLNDDDSGVLIASVSYGSSAWNILQPGDTLLNIDGLSIANNGTVQYHGQYRTRYDVVLGERFLGDKLELVILRDGKRCKLNMELEPLKFLVPRSQYDQNPIYFVYAGLVFQTLSRDFLSTWKNWWDEGPKEFLHYYYSGLPEENREEVIILSQILADEINVGYEDFYNESILSVNGHLPKNMKDFVNIIQNADEIVEIKTSGHGVIVFNVPEVTDATSRILERYQIGADRSPHLT